MKVLVIGSGGRGMPWYGKSVRVQKWTKFTVRQAMPVLRNRPNV